ncbi:MAG: hypothetical protein DMF45_10060 [Verrucomicrobia bacterium]|nr:MAG: hypothetical protein DMF45_10060 [Verrucomicrobiota bacterium]
MATGERNFLLIRCGIFIGTEFIARFKMLTRIQAGFASLVLWGQPKLANWVFPFRSPTTTEKPML